MKTEEKASTIRINRKVYERGLEIKNMAMERGLPEAYSTISWFSVLIDRQLDVLEENINKEDKGDE